VIYGNFESRAPKPVKPSLTVSDVLEINPRLDRVASSAERAKLRQVRQRRLEQGRRTYIAYSAHDLLAGDHEVGRPGHSYE
jgi:hypothetical protein